MSVSKQTIVIAGLSVNVYTTKDAVERLGSIAVLFLLHGRQGSSQHNDQVARDILDAMSLKTSPGHAASRDLFIVTLDHRNHGTRLVDPQSNEAWSGDDRHNDQHALDMYSIQTGTAKDVSFLIDFLPSYLFPLGNRIISKWMVAGVSLGGHSTWILLRNEPRISLGIPIIGCADYLALVAERAKHSAIPVQPPYFPESLIAFVKQNDPVYAPFTALDASNPFLGKQILALSGGKDELVPWAATSGFFERLVVGEDGVKEFVLESETGHRLTPTMTQEMVRFLWECGLKK